MIYCYSWCSGYTTHTLFNNQNPSANLAHLFIKTKQIFFTDSIILVQTGFTQGKKLKKFVG